MVFYFQVDSRGLLQLRKPIRDTAWKIFAVLVYLKVHEHACLAAPENSKAAQPVASYVQARNKGKSHQTVYKALATMPYPATMIPDAEHGGRRMLLWMLIFTEQ